MLQYWYILKSFSKLFTYYIFLLPQLFDCCRVFDLLEYQVPVVVLFGRRSSAYKNAVKMGVPNGHQTVLQGRSLVPSFIKILTWYLNFKVLKVSFILGRFSVKTPRQECARTHTVRIVIVIFFLVIMSIRMMALSGSSHYV